MRVVGNVAWRFLPSEWGMYVFMWCTIFACDVFVLNGVHVWYHPCCVVCDMQCLWYMCCVISKYTIFLCYMWFVFMMYLWFTNVPARSFVMYSWDNDPSRHWHFINIQIMFVPQDKTWTIELTFVTIITITFVAMTTSTLSSNTKSMDMTLRAYIL